MREIKFRGKALMSLEELDQLDIPHENGWVYGSLISNGKSPMIVGDIADWGDDYIAHEWYVAVEPESVGQFTGLHDKNGVDIYEGDIVRYLDGFDTSTESGFDFAEYMNQGEITFDDSCALYDVTNKESVCREDLFEGDGAFEVVGNIYENPELLIAPDGPVEMSVEDLPY